MPAPQNNDELLGLLRKSNLLEPAKIDAFWTVNVVAEDTPASICTKLRSSGLLTPFQSDQLVKGKHKGFFLGKYKILDRIGLGGMGQVFLAEHVSMRRRAALKVMPPDRAENQYSRERFLREARAAGQLDHPNLVRAFDVDTASDVLFLVMEFVDGVSFQDLVTRHGPMSADRAGQYLWQVALGLDYLHARGLIHRDIKPANLLVDRQGIVKVLDLGLVRSEVEDDNLTRGEGVKILGTADYLSPEQAIDCSNVDIRTDIYSLGATAYYLLTGRPPFESDKMAQKLLAHQMKPIKPLHEVNPLLPRELSDIVSKMLAKKPEHRYQTPAELAEALAMWGQKRVPLPTDEEIPPLLGGTLLSGSEPRSGSRTGGSSVNLSGGLSGSSSGSSLKYFPESKLPLKPLASDSGKAVPAATSPPPAPISGPPVVTPAPRLPASAASKPAPIAPALPEDPVPPVLPATVTHGGAEKREPLFPKPLRPKVELHFELPPLPSAESFKPTASAPNWRYRTIMALAIALILGLGAWDCLLLSSMVTNHLARIRDQKQTGGSPESAQGKSQPKRQAILAGTLAP